MYIGMFSSTNYNRVIIENKLDIGSDIKVIFLDAVSYLEYESIYHDIKSIYGVVDIAVASILPLTYQYKHRSGAYTIINVYAISLNYFNVTRFKQEYLSDVQLNEIDDVLMNNKLIVSYVFKKEKGMHRDDIIYLEGEKIPHIYRIGGFIKLAPGIVSDVYDLQRFPYIFMGMNRAINVLGKENIMIDYLFINIRSDVDKEMIVNQINKYFADVGIPGKAISEKENLRMNVDMRSRIYFSRILDLYYTISLALGFIIIIITSKLTKKYSIKEKTDKTTARIYILNTIAFSILFALIPLFAYTLFIMSQDFRGLSFIYPEKYYLFYYSPLEYKISLKISSLVFIAIYFAIFYVLSSIERIREIS